MKDTAPLSTWQRVAALTVEGLYLLPVVLLRVTECIGVWQLADPERITPLSPTDPMLWLVGGSWLLQVVCLPPLRLGRVAWYQRLAAVGGIPPLRLLYTGFRRWGGAIRWRWQIWWRRLVAAAVVALPIAGLWGLAHRLSATGQTVAGLLWAGIGALFILPGVAAVWLWGIRYAPAPLLLLAGCPAGAAIGLAARAMAGHRRSYVDLWGDQVGRLAACMLVFPAPLILPGLRLQHVRWLHRRLESAPLSVFSAAAPVGGCILPPAPL